MAFDPIYSESINSSEDRYNEGIRQRMMENSRRGKYNKFVADNEALVANLSDYFHSEGRPTMSKEIYEFGSQEDYKKCLKDIKDWDFKNPRNDFLDTMWESLNKWGQLTEKQIKVVNKVFASREKFIKQSLAKQADMVKSSAHVGTVGERQTFTAKVEKIISGEGQFGFWHITKMICEETGQQLVYKNTINIKDTVDEEGHPVSHFVDEGDTVQFDAKIKEHSDFNGVKQTVLQRATKSKIITKKENS